ncbi:DUF2273 domain-containing protein [Thermincola potens]|uniref:Small integral membrane protein n=1 Tax=Thermincola potens (strain JR) TaxID=635013 RepID=D5X7J5_THEPJ|nr:DUF2273 domain-containing protein [Thermincola potens]ADG82565.1 Protein of unknown function DUF2273 [Thermincola potens JR]
MRDRSWQDFLGMHLGKILGVTLGLLLGWMVIEYGLLKTLFVIILIVLGYFIGKKADEDEDILMAVRRFFRGY